MGVSPTSPLRGSWNIASPLPAFALAFFSVVTLEFVAWGQWMPEFATSLLQIAVLACLMRTLLPTTKPLLRIYKIATLSAVALLFTSLSLEACSQADFLRAVPLIGPASKSGKVVQQLLSWCLTFNVLLLAFALMKELARLSRDVSDKALSLSEATAKYEGSLKELQEANDQVIWQTRLSVAGQLVGGVAHDLNNALTPVTALVTQLRPEEVPEAKRETLEMLQTGADYASQLLKQFQFFYQPRRQIDASLTEVNLPDVARKAVQLTRFLWHDEAMRRGAHYYVETNLQDGCLVKGHSTELTQVVCNLLINAIEAMPNGGRVSLSIERVGGQVRLAVSDEGYGMNEDQKLRCFEPFFTTKDRGSGLGLSVCRQIIERYQGSIEAQTNESSGSAFVIHLPDPNHGGELDAKKSARVLVVDDNQYARNATSALLRSFDLRVDSAENGQFGLKVARDTDFSAIFVDFAMPGLGGAELVTALKDVRPDTPVILVSGWSTSSILPAFHDGVRPDWIIEKPLTQDAVRACLAHFGLLDSSATG